MSDEIRAEFEAWWQAPIEGMDARKNDMFECSTDDAWSIWQASRLAALEECAQICDDITPSFLGDNEANEAATEIRRPATENRHGDNT